MVENFTTSYRPLTKFAKRTFKLVISFRLYLDVVSFSAVSPLVLSLLLDKTSIPYNLDKVYSSFQACNPRKLKVQAHYIDSCIQKARPTELLLSDILPGNIFQVDVVYRTNKGRNFWVIVFPYIHRESSYGMGSLAVRGQRLWSPLALGFKAAETRLFPCRRFSTVLVCFFVPICVDGSTNGTRIRPWPARKQHFSTATRFTLAVKKNPLRVGRASPPKYQQKKWQRLKTGRTSKGAAIAGKNQEIPSQVPGNGYIVSIV